MKRLLWLTLLFAVLAGSQTLNQSSSVAVAQDTPPASVQQADVILEGPTKAKIGDLIIIDASKSKVTDLKWDISPKTKNFVVVDNGRKLIFSASLTETHGSTTVYEFTVAGAFEGTVDMEKWTVTIKGQPNDLESKVLAWCEQLPTPLDARKAEAIRLATSFNTVASLIDAGSFDNPQAVLEATKKANQDALLESKDLWTPFFVGLQGELSRLNGEGKLSDAAAHAPVWRVIADSLRTFAASSQ